MDFTQIAVLSAYVDIEFQHAFWVCPYTERVWLPGIPLSTDLINRPVFDRERLVRSSVTFNVPRFLSDNGARCRKRSKTWFYNFAFFRCGLSKLKLFRDLKYCCVQDSTHLVMLLFD